MPGLSCFRRARHRARSGWSRAAVRASVPAYTCATGIRRGYAALRGGYAALHPYELALVCFHPGPPATGNGGLISLGMGIPSYFTVHGRLRVQRGPARGFLCTRCGAQAQEWALTGEPKWLDPRPYTDDLDAYVPMCNSCHQALDHGWPPCPHGPERATLTDGRCRACFNDRSRARYANMPEEQREAMRAAQRARWARRREARQLDDDQPML